MHVHHSFTNKQVGIRYLVRRFEIVWRVIGLAMFHRYHHREKEQCISLKKKDLEDVRFALYPESDSFRA